MALLQKRCASLAGIILLLVLFLWPNVTHAQASEITLDEYWNLLEETRDVVEGGSSAAERQQALHDLAVRWQAVDQITMPDGTSVQVNHQHLISELRATHSDVDSLQERLAAMAAVRERWSTTVYSRKKAAEVIVVLNEILSDPAFQWPEEQSSPRQRLMERLERLLLDLLPDRSGEIAGSRLLRLLLTGIAVGALLAVLIYVARTFLTGFSAATHAADEEMLEGDITADAALEQAEALSNKGDFRTAVRYLYLSTLLLLDERELLQYDRAQTNREYLKSVAKHPELAATLRSVIDVFDRVWYGYQPLDQAAYASYEAQVRELQGQR